MEGTPYYDPKNPQCDKEQLAMLERCSKHLDISEWNEWRKGNLRTEVYLQRANLSSFFLQEANLESVHLEGAILDNAYLKKTVLKSAYLEQTQLVHTIFSGANLNNAKIIKAVMFGTKFDYSFLQHANFEKTNLWYVNFNNANLSRANFKKADLWSVDLSGADFSFVNLEEACIWGGTDPSTIKSTDFTGSIVSTKTVILNCYIDEKTNFSMVGLDSAQIAPSLLAALKTNIRRISWNNYYKEQGKLLWGRVKTLPIRLFWWLSDYGSSSERIFLSILISILLFTNAYLIIGSYAPNVISLPEQGAIATPDIVPISDSYIRVICFAISTMVTLGFGGINVTIDKTFQGWSNFAFILVTLNLILGYLFLSVLVTRFGILFQSQAPEQKAKETNNTILYFVALILFVLGSYMLFCWEDIIGFINYAALITVLFGMGYFHFK